MLSMANAWPASTAASPAEPVASALPACPDIFDERGACGSAAVLSCTVAVCARATLGTNPSPPITSHPTLMPHLAPLQRRSGERRHPWVPTRRACAGPHGSGADGGDFLADQAGALAEVLQAQAEDVPDGEGHLADVVVGGRGVVEVPLQRAAAAPEDHHRPVDRGVRLAPADARRAVDHGVVEQGARPLLDLVHPLEQVGPAA